MLRKVAALEISSFLLTRVAGLQSTVCNASKNELPAREIPVNVLKNRETCLLELINWINEAIRDNKFPDSLKLSDITTVYKKLDPCGKASYRPVSVLPLLSKVFEKNHSWPALWIYGKLPEWVIVWFPKDTSEMAGLTWLGGLCWYNFLGFV